MTFISNSKKFIFVHPHKCAGTSIERALSKTLQWNDIILGSTQYGEQIQAHFKRKFNLSKHSCVADIQKVVGNDIWDSYFSFSVVRHPFDRMVSLYEYLQKIKNRGNFISHLKLKTKIFFVYNKRFPWIAKHPIIEKKGIHKWPEIRILEKSRNFSEFLVNILPTNAPGIIPQYDFLIDQNQSKVAVDYVCKLENLENDWEYICEKLNISYRLPHSNKSKKNRKSWQEYYTVDDINLMLEKYKVDLDMFDYSI